MPTEIQATDVRIRYASIAEARRMSGLRLVLGAYAIPGPWREGCKGLFHVKGIPFASVVTCGDGGADLRMGMDGADRELREWTGQSSAPVAIWNDERPRSTWIEQIALAERLNPDPPLVPSAFEDRVRMYGLCNEICGENGLGWCKRLVMVDAGLAALPAGDPGRPSMEHVGRKYGHSPDAAAHATDRIVEILGALDRQLREQQARGRQFLIGEHLTALDIYWATFAALFDPLPPDLCPMATAMRGAYANHDPRTRSALTRELIAHRDFVYRRYLELPIVF
ncbi:MAG: glutathione S-transferase C-terminal domain-containing protein [Gammaproteobacteria bacterium]